MEELRDHLQHHVTVLQEVLRKVQLQLENPAPAEMEPYDMEADLMQSEPHDDEED